MKIDIIAGARPNFMKIAPIISENVSSKNKNTDISYRLIHTGQHYNDELSKIFFTQLRIPKPQINLNVGCPSKAVQKGSFGACLMKDKILVRNCMEALQNDKIEATLKCRLGLGSELNYEFFEEFIDEISKSGIKIIYVHVPTAFLAINIYFMMFVTSVIWLIRRHHVSLIAAKSAAPIGFLSLIHI